MKKSNENSKCGVPWRRILFCFGSVPEIEIPIVSKFYQHDNMQIMVAVICWRNKKEVWIPTFGRGVVLTGGYSSETFSEKKIVFSLIVKWNY